MLMSRAERALDVLEVMNVVEPYTSQDIADEMGVARRTAHNYLEILHEDGRIHRKDHSPNRVSWWRTE